MRREGGKKKEGRGGEEDESRADKDTGMQRGGEELSLLSMSAFSSMHQKRSREKSLIKQRGTQEQRRRLVKSVERFTTESGEK